MAKRLSSTRSNTAFCRFAACRAFSGKLPSNITAHAPACIACSAKSFPCTCSPGKAKKREPGKTFFESNTIFFISGSVSPFNSIVRRKESRQEFKHSESFFSMRSILAFRRGLCKHTAQSVLAIALHRGNRTEHSRAKKTKKIDKNFLIRIYRIRIIFTGCGLI